MKKVLFVCMSNSRRSQMAAAIYSKISGHKAKSAGIDPAGCGFRVDADVIAVLNEIGIDASGSKSKKLTEDMLDEADVIITFRCSDKIPERYKEKTEDWELGVKREIGQKQRERTREEIRDMRDRIFEKVKTLADRLEKE